MNKTNFPTYNGAVLFVKNVEVAKRFYTDVLGQRIEMDFGRCVGFIGGFSIWDLEYAWNMMEMKPPASEGMRHELELYFECEDISSLVGGLKQEGIDFVHAEKEQPWGQRCVRFFDPDHHVIECAEPMVVVVRRYHEMGWSVERIMEKTMMPEEMVQMVIKG